MIIKKMFRDNALLRFLIIVIIPIPVSVSAADNPLIYHAPLEQKVTPESFVMDKTIYVIVPENEVERDIFQAGEIIDYYTGARIAEHSYK